MKVLFIITARGGSKGVPKKNIKKLGNIPLIAYKIIAAQKCKFDSRIIVSTDDKEIADIALQYGADVPFMRPQYLAEDNSSSMDVIEHTMNWVKKNDENKYDYVCMLEPSSPFASYKDLDNALELLEKTKADTLLGVKEVEVNRCFIHSLDENGRMSKFYDVIKDMKSVRRQDQLTEYTMNGCMYIAKWDYFEKNKLFHSTNCMPYIMSGETSIEIDTMWDYKLASWLVETEQIDLTLWK